MVIFIFNIELDHIIIIQEFCMLMINLEDLF